MQKKRRYFLRLLLFRFPRNASKNGVLRGVINYGTPFGVITYEIPCICRKSRLAYYGGGGPGNYCSRVSQVARTIARSRESYCTMAHPCMGISPAKVLGDIGRPREARFRGGRDPAKALPHGTPRGKVGSSSLLRKRRRVAQTSGGQVERRVAQAPAGVGRNADSSCCWRPLAETSPPFSTWYFRLSEVGSYEVGHGRRNPSSRS